MKKVDLTKKSANDLNKLLSEKREKHRKFRFDVSGSKIKNIKEGKNLKKDIARALTALKSKTDSK